MDIETHTPDEIDAANNLINLNNTVYMNHYLYHPNREIRNHNRTRVAIEISNYLKSNNKNYNYNFFEKIINAFSYFQKNIENKRIPPDFLSIFWKILIRQQELYNLILTQNIINIMLYDFQILNKTIEEIEIENRILNLYQ
jgi:hypothetical protein